MFLGRNSMIIIRIMLLMIRWKFLNVCSNLGSSDRIRLLSIGLVRLLVLFRIVIVRIFML